MKLFYLLLIFSCLSSSLSANVINGKIIDAAKNPIVGAYVIHLQSEHHAHTNELGQFLLNDVEIGDTLQIMHLGYETLFYPITDLSDEIVIQLKESIFDLNEVVVGQNIKKLNIISSIDIMTAPVNSSQEILRKVPGLFIGQHAGGGKAEQIFLRGFDIDHGTDVSISVDGLPVNMVSHAHGQGYADLHFLIPETIESLDFGKGPYYSDQGNFSTAGYVKFQTKKKLENSLFSLEAGQFNTLRTVAMLKLLNTEKHNIYLAVEYLLSDGPFDSSQNFNRSNFMLKYSGRLNSQDFLDVTVSHFNSTWDASGQIPVRAVDQGLITRFGAIDDTEGGTTGRSNIAINHTKAISKNSFVKTNAFYSAYDFELFSNFTFLLNDPINGDQIRQKEKRQLFGLESVWNYSQTAGTTDATYQIGVGLRSDDIKDNQLSRTLNRRTTLSRIQFGDVAENNFYGFANAEFDFGNLLIQPGLRYDYFKFNYIDALDTLYNNQSQGKGIFSPKLNFVYNINKDVQLFLKSGIGFHSNDARVVLDQEADAILPAAFGVDLGTILKPANRIITNVALWYLFLEQEFVYVGDEGIVEPSGRTRRLGVDLGIRYQLADWLFFTGDANYAFARSIDEPEDFNRIPLAPSVTAAGGFSVDAAAFKAGIQMRYLQDRPANEDNSIVAHGYFITDLNANYTFKKITLGFSIENLFNQDWNETQFATESRLINEPQGIEEIHFTPGTPFFIKGIMKYKF